MPVYHFCIGIIGGASAGSALICFVFFIISFVYLFFRSGKTWAISAGLMVILFRLLVEESDSLPEYHISGTNGKDVIVRAVVTDDMTIKSDKVSSVVEVRSLCVELTDTGCSRWVERIGKVQVWFPRYPKVRLGEVWEISGDLEEPQHRIDEFEYSDYLASKDVFSVIYKGNFRRTGMRSGNQIFLTFWDIGAALRDRIEDRLPEPHASLLSGMLFGFRSGQFEDFSDELQRCGVTHVIAASGYNVSVVMSFIGAITAKLHRRVRLVVSMIGMWCFALIAGASTPVIRAAFMSSYACAAKLLGRPSSVHVSFLVSMAFFFFRNPDVLNDVSFQLSYASTAGLLYIVPVLERWIPEKLNSIFENATVTISAICATLPISLFHFGSFSSIALAVNIITLPVVAPAMGLGMVSIVIPKSLGFFSQAITAAAWVPLDIFVKTVSFFAEFPFAMILVGKINYVELLALYIILAFLVFFLRFRGSRKNPIS